MQKPHALSELTPLAAGRGSVHTPELHLDVVT